MKVYDMYNTEREISFRDVNKIAKLEDSLESINRTVKADFIGNGIGCNLEGALKIKLSDGFNLKPYLELDAKTSHYNSIKEKSADGFDLNIKTENYNRVFAKTGLVIERKIGKFNWNANVEYKRLLGNNLPEITRTLVFASVNVFTAENIKMFKAT